MKKYGFGRLVCNVQSPNQLDLGGFFGLLKLNQQVIEASVRSCLRLRVSYFGDLSLEAEALGFVGQYISKCGSMTVFVRRSKQTELSFH